MQARRTQTAKTSTNFNKLRKRLERLTGQAISDYGMIADGDKVMVCLSGGKDSYTLLDVLLALRARAPIHFDILAMNLDQKQPGFPEDVLPGYLEARNVPYLIVEQDTYSVVKDKIPEGKTMCSLCSRLRRGVIYRVAAEQGATKIALGHHRDDILETFFLNLFYGGRLKAMPPKLVSDDRSNVVIRPLAYVSERDIARYARARNFPIIPCTLCGSQPNLQRQHIKTMLQTWHQTDPKRLDTIFRALSHTSPSHLLDGTLFDFAGLTASTRVTEGDTAFDDEAFGDEDGCAVPLHPEVGQGLALDMH
ncbi:MAG: tRNA 2-thiocytidine(32) synthetase TtcA [Deinococcota bacterium]